jgi:hypothetical protein
MKKLTSVQLSFVFIISLVLGFLVGTRLDYFEGTNKQLAGTIGKVERYRNVKVSQNDLLLRNELIEDSVKRLQYEKYLLIYYYQSLNTQNDLNHVLALTDSVPEFQKTYYPYSDALKTFSQFLEPAREDILYALNVILDIDGQAEVPIIEYLNMAQNAIARIQAQNGVLLNYMNAIETFLQSKEIFNQCLADAHDILYLNTLQAAIFTHNKPVLTYLDELKLRNDKEGVKKLMAESNVKSQLLGYYKDDAKKLKNHFADKSEGSLNLHSFDQLNIEVNNSIHILGDAMINVIDVTLGTDAMVYADIVESHLLNEESFGVEYNRLMSNSGLDMVFLLSNDKIEVVAGN